MGQWSGIKMERKREREREWRAIHVAGSGSKTFHLSLLFSFITLVFEIEFLALKRTLTHFPPEWEVERRESPNEIIC